VEYDSFSLIHRVYALTPLLLLLLLPDCKGNKASATVTLKYEVPATAAADTYSYSKLPLQVAAATGVLANDRNAPSCIAQNKPVTIAVVTSTTKGNLQARLDTAVACTHGKP
jgi:hypothetical protein